MIAFLIDADNFSEPAWIDEAFQTLERTEGPIAIRRAYGSAENLKGLADTLRVWAIRPFVNLPPYDQIIYVGTGHLTHPAAQEAEAAPSKAVTGRPARAES